MENNENQVYENALNVKPPIYKKWWFWVIIAVVAIAVIAGAGGSSNNVDDQGTGGTSQGGTSNVENQGSSSSNQAQSNKNNLGDFNIVIKSCRVERDYEKKPIAIVKYEFTNNSKESAAFWTTFDDKVYQNGIGLNECYIAADSANYSSDNAMKEIKPGATLEVEIAYTLNDSTTPLDVEVSEYFSFDDKVVKKTFTIAP